MFDTRDATDRLKGAGANDELAREIVNLLKEQADQAVTKEYLNERLELTEARMKNHLGGQVRTWVAAGTGLIALLMTLFEFIR